MGVTVGTTFRFGTERVRHCGRPFLRGLTVAWVGLSKIDDYRVDNVRCNRLSDLRRVVNHRSPWRVAGGQAEDRAVLVGSAFIRCPVEGSVAGLDYARVRIGPVRALLLGTEAVQRGQVASGGDLENRAMPVR